MPFNRELPGPDGAALLVSDRRELMDFSLLRQWLADTYWTPGISMEQLRRQVDNSSLVFGLYELDSAGGQPGRMLGFGRVISDLTRFAYLSDVVIAPDMRRRGLGGALCAAILGHPELEGVVRWVLMTEDAHGVYEKLGFKPLAGPQRWLERKQDGPGKWL